jgi:hypothetical protein
MLVISYKKAYENYCRNCLMESYSSDHQIQHFATIEEAIRHCATLNSKTQIEQINGANRWEHYFIFDGFEARMVRNLDEWDETLNSMGAADGYCQPDPETQAKIDALTMEMYDRFVTAKNAKAAIEKKQKEEKELQIKLAEAKKLLKEHGQG